jgi:hypothetical protein
MSDTNILNSTPAFRHVILHFDRIENSNSKQQQRRIESLFKYCNRCILHVKSLKEHYSYHHPLNSNINEHDEETNFGDLKRNNYHQTNDSKRMSLFIRICNSSFILANNHRSYPIKFDRNKQLPMATIRRRQTTPNNYEQVRLTRKLYLLKYRVWIILGSY